MNHIKNEKKIIYIFFVTIVLSIIAGFFIFNHFMKWHKSKMIEVKITEEVKYNKEIKKLKKKIVSLDSEITLQKESIIPSEKVKSVFKITKEEGDAECLRIKDNIQSFFDYLDQQSYANKDKSSKDLYADVIIHLSENQPVFSDHATEVLTLLRSMSHMYRVLGKENVFQIKNILKNEKGMLEPALESFHEWFLVNNNCTGLPTGKPSFETLYNYACFFQNTLAGKSYLLRRSSKTRILLSYYSLLIIDRANDQSLNIYGLDIRPSLALIYEEVQNHRKLLYKKKYLETLNAVIKKYPAVKSAVY